MTEAEWLACEEPLALLNFCTNHASDRRLRLLLAACSRRAPAALPDKTWRKALRVAEEVADGIAPEADLRPITRTVRLTEVQARTASRGSCHVMIPPDPHWDLLQGLLADNATLRHRIADCVVAILAAKITSAEAMCRLFRDIFGNPFRPVTVDPSWLTSTVVSLARGIYDERAFDRMPILADALQDAGCDNDDILTHCRGPGPHVRGCWVVDQLLGKE